ncbi:MAG: hypothetical protein LUC33_05060 [Prevotellaceae bacterium]|nr:hypothetical protein [Prevotellaceae bacterium]
MHSRVFCQQCRKEKVLFSTRAEAQSVLRQYKSKASGGARGRIPGKGQRRRRRGRNGNIPKRAYWREACRGWHLTHKASEGTAVKREPRPYTRVSWRYSPD